MHYRKNLINLGFESYVQNQETEKLMVQRRTMTKKLKRKRKRKQNEENVSDETTADEAEKIVLEAGA